MQAKRQTPGILRKIDHRSKAVPGNVLTPESAATQRRMRLPERNHAFEEQEYVLIRLEPAPIQPVDFVVLVVGIIVSELCIQELVTRPEHRDAVREHEEAEEVFSLFPAKCQNLRWHALVSFLSAVPTVIRVHTVLIVMTVFPVVFLIVRNQVVERKAVVAIDIVDGLEGMIGMLPAVREQVIAAINATHKVWDHPCVAPDETADMVAITRVPLQPGRARKSTSKLIAADVPRLRDQRQPAQLGVRGNFTEYRSLSPIERSVCVTAKHRCKIEAKSIDVHLVLPIPQAVHYHFAHVCLAEIQRVAGARVIGVWARRVGGRHVIACSVETLEAVRRAD